MFLKCVKHEFRATKRQLIPLFIAILAASVFAGVFIGVTIRLFERTTSAFVMLVSSLISTGLGFLVFGLMAAVAIVAFVMIIRRFYTSFFTDEGYLSLTLPVSMDTHILSKFAVAYIWELLAGIVAVVSFFIIFFFIAVITTDFSALIFPTIDDLADFMDGIAVIWEALREVFGEFAVVFTFILAIFNIFITTAASILILYLSIAVACMLAKKNRIILGIVCYYVISMIFGTLSTVFQVVLLFVFEENNMLPTMISTIVLSLLQVAAGYFGTRWVMTKKLNLT